LDERLMTRLEAWEAYGQRCREETKRQEAAYWAAWGKSPKTPPTPEQMRAIDQQCDDEHAASWALYIAEVDKIKALS
jgi:hypothetical protein